MASSDHPQTEAVQPTADEKWVFLQDDGDSGKEEEQDGEANGEKERIPDTAEGKDGGQDTGKWFWWCRSAWNDPSVHSAFWDDKRPYILGAALFVNAVLNALVALTSLTECKTLQAVLTSLKHFTTAILSVAVSSMVTRFLSLSAVRASGVKQLRPFTLLSDLAVMNINILLGACITCIYEVWAGIMVFLEVRQQEKFGWLLQLFADMEMVQAFTWTVVLAIWLVVLMSTDISATLRVMLHRRRQDQEESWKRAASRMLERPGSAYRRSLIFRPWTHITEVFFIVVCTWAMAVLWLLLPKIEDHARHTTPATSGGI